MAAHASLSVGDFSMLYSGTTPFDTNDGPGNDSGTNNTVIRSNDSVGYRFFYQTTGGDTNARAVLTAPAGARWSYVPAGCGPGSSIVGQVLTCMLGDIPNSQAQNIDFEMNVGPRSQGASVPPAAVVFTSDQTTTPPVYTPPPVLTSSAAPRWDVVKTESGYGQIFRVDSGPGGAAGYILPYNIMVQAENYQGRGGADSLKGLAPLGSTIVINDTLPTPSALIMDYPNPYQTTGACNGHPTGFYQYLSAIADTGPASSTDPQYVANGGSCAAVQVGQTATLTLTGVDSSLTHRPSLFAGSGIPPSDIRTTTIISKNLFVWIPQSDVPLGGLLTPVTNTIPATTFTSQDGLQTYTEATTSNNSYTHGLRNGGPGTYSKLSVPWSYQMGLPVDQMDAPGGVPNGYADAVNTTIAGSRWRPRLALTNSSSLSMTNLHLCDYLDNARQNLIETSPGVYVTVLAQLAAPSAGAPQPPIPAANYVVEYGTGGVLDPAGQWTSVGGGNSAQYQARCNDPGVTWVTNPTTLTGGVAAVTRIRIRYTEASGLPPGAEIIVRYGVELRPTWRYTTDVVAPATFAGTYAAGSDITPNDSFYSPADYRVYNRVTATADGWLEDTGYSVAVGVRRASVFNTLRKSSVSPSESSPDPVGIGEAVKYQLALYSRNIGYAGPETLTVTDVLPPGLSYAAGTSTYIANGAQNGVANPSTGFGGGLPGVLAGEPAVTPGAAGCPTCTSLVWTINNTQPAFSFDNTDSNSWLGTIEFDAVVGVLPSGAQLLNSATMDSPHDFAADCTYQGPAAGFGGQGCEKAANKSLLVSAPPGFYVAKTTSSPTRPINSTMTFNLALAGIGGDVNNARWIDILPYNGDASLRTSTGSSFTGTLVLASVITPAGVTATYTKVPPGSLNADPSHASNTSLGSIWCASLSGGACPASMAEVTALRFESPQLASGTVYDVAINLQAVGNGGGGSYVNNFRAIGMLSGNNPVLISQDARIDVASVIHVVTGTAGPGGSIGPGSQEVTDGNTATLAITPDFGYDVDQITTTCSGGAVTGSDYTTLPVYADCNVHVTFKSKALSTRIEPVPTLGEAGLVLLCLALMGGGALRRRDMGQRRS